MDTTSDCELSVEELARLIDNLNKTIDLDVSFTLIAFVRFNDARLDSPL